MNSLQEILILNFSEGIHVYVLDTGVNTEHLDFEGRASTDVNFVDHEDETDFGGHGKLFVIIKK